MEFHEKLFRLRKEKGLSQEELGNLLHVARQTVSKWESGETTPELEKLMCLADIFDVSLDELVGRNVKTGQTENEQPENGQWDSRQWEYGPQKSQGEDSGCLRNGWYAHPYRHGWAYEYEYKSKTKICGIPLVHINLGYGLRKAKGIIAVGNVAKGIVAIGGAALGIISIGGASVGLLSLGGAALGLLSLGAAAVGGAAEFYIKNGWPQFSPEEVRQAIVSRFPNTWKVIVDLFVRASSW